MAADAVDVGYLAAFFSVPESTLQSFLENPIVDLAQSLLQQFEAKAREFDEVKAEKLRSDVELENAIRSGDARARALKASVDKGIKDAEELQRKLNEEQNARAKLESELQNLQSSTSSSTSEIEALHSRIRTLEAANRDAIALHEAKSTAHDRVAEDLSEQHRKNVSLRKQVSELEDQNQTLVNESTNTKYRENTLRQEIALLKKNNDWYETELKTRTAEHTKFRKEKNAQITDLQRFNVDANQNVESLRRTETTLRQRNEELNQKVEDSLLKIQQLQESAAKQQESFRAELEGVQRLADLQKQSADTAKARLLQVDSELQQVKDSATQELGQIQAEIETERSQRTIAEARIEELESQVEVLESQVSELRSSAHIPGTPRRGVNGTVGTPGRAGSPAIFSPGTPRSRGGMTVTQLYSENTQLKADLRASQEKQEQLRESMNDMLSELEQRQPEVAELREQHDRLTVELGEISALLDEAAKERENARKETRKWQAENQGHLRECEILRQQLRDLSAQVKLLVVEQQAQAQGLESLSAEQQQYLEQVARNELDPSQLDDTTDTGRVISSRLVLFKNVHELQSQNAELLRTIRAVAETYEGTEAQAKSNQIEKDRQELEQLREKVAQYEDELQSLTTRSRSFMKERDMFRRMLTHRGQLPAGSDAASIFGQSVDERATATPPPGNMIQSVEQSPSSKEIAQYAKLIKDMQAHFDAYKQESATDHASLKQQADRLAKEKSDLSIENARLGSQITLARERYDLLQQRFSALKTENDEILKRYQSLQETAARQDIRTQQAVEDIVEARGAADSLRNENANLKAERELWKSIEARMTSEISQLMSEKEGVKKSLADLEALQNAREHSEKENQRRLQSKAESLESELQIVKRKLDDEIEASRATVSRREYEQEQSRTRIDDLNKALNKTKEDLIATRTERDIFEARVNELKAELRIAQEMAQALPPRPTPRVNGSIEPADPTAGEDGITREEQLAIEISNLKRELERVEEQVKSAKAEVERYKGISQDAELQMQELQDSYDEYTQNMDQKLAEKDAKISELQQSVQEISSELQNTYTQLSGLQKAQEENTRHFNQQKEILESEITHLKDESERYRETAKLHQEDLKVQADIAQRAQQNYENELMRHGEATKNLRDLREEHNTLKTEVAEIKAQGEAARTSLAQSEEHWVGIRERYERELTELRTRNDDLKKQNELLHKQLENVTSQIASLKQSRVSVAGGELDVANPDSDIEGLREVVRYLRREKEIVDVQYGISIQEAKRYKQQLDYTKSQLDETREKLDSERLSHAENEQNAISQSKLRDTINELNTFRESSVTLRNETQQMRAQLSEKTKEVESLLAQIEPLQSRVREVESEIETKDEEIRLVQQDRDHWQQRTQRIMQKYDRVDPAELQSLKAQIGTLQAERDQAVAEKLPLQEQIDGFSEQLKEAVGRERKAQEAAFSERRESMIKQFKERSRQLSGKIKETESKSEALTKECDELKQQVASIQGDLASSRQQLASAQQELEATKVARDEAIANAEVIANARPTDTVMGNSNEEGQVDESISVEKQALEARAIAAESKANEESNRAKLKEELASAQKEVEDLRTSAAITATAGTTAEDGSKSVEEQVTERVAKIRADLDAKHTEKVKESDEKAKQAEDKFQQRADSMKRTLNAKLAEGKQAYQQKFDEDMQKLKSEHEEEIQQAQSVAQSAQQTTSTDDVAKGSAATEIMPAIKTEGKPAELSESAVKDLVATNPVIKSMVSRNIQKKLGEEKDVIANRVKEEQEKITAEKLEEAKQLAEKQKASAVEMESKRYTLKLSMAENRLKAATAKIDVVDKAATDTPERPIGEVWAIAKNTKPPAAAPTAPATQPPAVQAPQPSTDSQTASAPSTETATAPPAQPAQPTQTPGSQPQPQAPGTGFPQSNGAPGGGQSSIPTRGGGIPRPGRGGQQNQTQNQQQQNQGINIQGAGASQLPRGGGHRGRGRGGQGSPRGGLNPGAQQFTPGTGAGGQGAGRGQKRGRDDGGDGDGHQGGKRARGGGQ
ncbi:hypothetical protein K469DRAFT_551061 [Zopfia rhizophila CBS 207.26]|uniref:Uncharacterized protein n=1 Tax=Zopfia rhizophila CBS 207.26 TaxID=1314779 RepID=A0A6A6EPG2_9PEZI|nr:hypothetical protein K469DRAFT_551061 [Zopfia rhizophila CBS 207.26]